MNYLKKVDIYESIAEGNIFLIKYFKFEEKKLFEEFCKKDSKYCLEIFKKIEEKDEKYYKTFIGFYSCINLSEKYNCLLNENFIYGLSQTKNINNFKIILEKLLDSFLYKIIKYSAELDNEEVFDLTCEKTELFQTASSMILPHINFKYYEKLIKKGISGEDFIQGIMNLCFHNFAEEKDFVQIVQKLPLFDKIGTKELLKHSKFNTLAEAL